MEMAAKKYIQLIRIIEILNLQLLALTVHETVDFGKQKKELLLL